MVYYFEPRFPFAQFALSSYYCDKMSAMVNVPIVSRLASFEWINFDRGFVQYKPSRRSKYIHNNHKRNLNIKQIRDDRWRGIGLLCTIHLRIMTVPAHFFSTAVISLINEDFVCDWIDDDHMLLARRFSVLNVLFSLTKKLRLIFARLLFRK